MSIIREKDKSQNGGSKTTKHAKFSEKTSVSYPLIVYQGVKNVPFKENLTCFVFFLPPLWDSPFHLITDNN